METANDSQCIIHTFTASSEVADARFGAFTVFWVVTLCSDVVRCQHFGRPRCLHLQGEVSAALALVELWPVYSWCGIVTPFEV